MRWRPCWSFQTHKSLISPRSASSAAKVAPVVTNTDKTISYSVGSQIILPVDVSNPTAAAISGVYIQINGATSYYKVPIQATSSAATIAIPVNVPNTVTSGQFKITFKFSDANGNVNAPQTVTITITPGENCNRTKVLAVKELHLRCST